MSSNMSPTFLTLATSSQHTQALSRSLLMKCSANVWSDDGGRETQRRGKNGTAQEKGRGGLSYHAVLVSLKLQSCHAWTVAPPSEKHKSNHTNSTPPVATGNTPWKPPCKVESCARCPRSDAKKIRKNDLERANP